MLRFLVITLALSPLGLSAAPATAQTIGVSISFAPPPLPVYVQPPVPAPDYLWTPGYWAWDDYVADYYWVPGTWVLAPRPGLLWTPPWWGWSDGTYLFHAGYWAPHVGFYGGVSYGFGYPGSGFFGAVWQGGHVGYNSVVTNVTNVHVVNVYRQTVVRTTNIVNVSYNGGPGGLRARATAAERAAAEAEPRLAPTAFQQRHIMAAQADRQLFASANGGRPPVAASARPAQFAGPGVVVARSAPDQPRPGASGFPTGPRPMAPGSSRDAVSRQTVDRAAAPRDIGPAYGANSAKMNILGRPGPGRPEPVAVQDLWRAPGGRPPAAPSGGRDASPANWARPIPTTDSGVQRGFSSHAPQTEAVRPAPRQPSSDRPLPGPAPSRPQPHPPAPHRAPPPREEHRR